MILFEQLKKWKEELNQYCIEHCGNGDWVEFIEKDEYASQLQENIDKAEDYLKDKYQPYE